MMNELMMEGVVENQGAAAAAPAQVPPSGLEPEPDGGQIVPYGLDAVAGAQAVMQLGLQGHIGDPNKRATKAKYAFLDNRMAPHLVEHPLQTNAGVRRFQRDAPPAVIARQHRCRDAVHVAVQGMPEDTNEEMRAKITVGLEAWDRENEVVVVGTMGSGKTLCASVMMALYDKRHQEVDPDIVGVRFARWWNKVNGRALHLNRGRKDCKNAGEEGLDKGYRAGGPRDIKDAGLVRAARLQEEARARARVAYVPRRLPARRLRSSRVRGVVARGHDRAEVRQRPRRRGHAGDRRRSRHLRGG